MKHANGDHSFTPGDLQNERTICSCILMHICRPNQICQVVFTHMVGGIKVPRHIGESLNAISNQVTDEVLVTKLLDGISGIEYRKVVLSDKLATHNKKLETTYRFLRWELTIPKRDNREWYNSAIGTTLI